MSRTLVALLVVLLGVAPAGADECVAECDRRTAACRGRAVDEVRDCRAAVRAACAAACECEGTEGATRTACLQRCEVCVDMQHRLAGRDCDAIESAGREDCEDEHDRCVRRCD